MSLWAKRRYTRLILCKKSRLRVGVLLMTMRVKVLNLCQKFSCQMMGNFYVYMAIMEGLSKLKGYDFDEHVLCNTFL